MMIPVTKFYFSRRETVNIYAKDEEEARSKLADLFVHSEDFTLDDVKVGIEIDGVFHGESR